MKCAVTIDLHHTHLFKFDLKHFIRFMKHIPIANVEENAITDGN
jgi:hypothetical protein